MGDDPAGDFRPLRRVSAHTGDEIGSGRADRGSAAGHGLNPPDHLAHHRPDDPPRDHLRVGALVHRAMERRRRADHLDGDAGEVSAGDPPKRDSAGGRPRLRGDLDVLPRASAAVQFL